MFNIIPMLLLFATSYLLPMKTLTTKLSNSSSEICFFINNIDHNFLQHKLPADVKKALLRQYSAITHDELLASINYSNLISSADYMHLQKNNKQTIQMLYSKNYPITIVSRNNNKILMLDNILEARIQYKKMLKLPWDIRCKIADEYSSMVFVKTKEKDNVLEQVSSLITFSVMALAGSTCCGIYLFPELKETSPHKSTKQLPEEYEDYCDRGYQPLPLLPEIYKK